MIHHVSIAARNPKHVACVLAELMGGRSYPFLGAVRDAYMAVSGDSHATLIEVYPHATMIRPGEGDAPATYSTNSASAPGLPVHILLSVTLARHEIEAIGKREGWRVRHFGRGAPGQPPVFHVIEFWVENAFLLEVVPPEHLGEYVASFQPEFLDSAIAALRGGSPQP